MGADSFSFGPAMKATADRGSKKRKGIVNAMANRTMGFGPSMTGNPAATLGPGSQMTGSNGATADMDMMEGATSKPFAPQGPTAVKRQQPAVYGSPAKKPSGQVAAKAGPGHPMHRASGAKRAKGNAALNALKNLK